MSDTITESTTDLGIIVRHRSGNEYVVSGIAKMTDGRVVNVSIKPNGEGEVFSGSPDEARLLGFAFGDEPFMSEVEASLIHAADHWVGEGQLLAGQALVHVRNLNALLTQRQSAMATTSQALRRTESTLRAAQQDREDFAGRVREAAIVAADENGLCTEGLNRWLGKLGLDLRPTKRRVLMKVTVSKSVWVEVEEATSDDDATEQAGEMDGDDLVQLAVDDSDDWQYEESEASDVEEA